MAKDNDTTEQTKASFVPSMDTLAPAAWKAANFITVLLTTSTAIALVQTPLKKLAMNLTRFNQSFDPQEHPRHGVLPAVLGLYRGLLPHLGGSTARSAYVTATKNGAKKNGSTTEVSELPRSPDPDVVTPNDQSERPQRETKSFSKFGYVSAVSLGDCIVTQYPDTLGKVRSVIKATDPSFKPFTVHNVVTIARTGLLARYNSSMVNFTALCIVSDGIAGVLPIHDPAAKHFAAGFLSGVAAAGFTYPIKLYADKLVAGVQVEDGKLSFPRMLTLGSDAMKYVKEVGWTVAAKESFKQFLKQAPARLGMTGATFALVSGIGEVMGDEPLQDLYHWLETSSVAQNCFGFFSRSGDKKAAITEIVETPIAQEQQEVKAAESGDKKAQEQQEVKTSQPRM